VGDVTAVIEGSAMCAGYGPIPAIRDIDIRVGAGQVVALLGSNGAGKTTVLRVLSGALAPSSGAVQWKGSVIRSPLHRRSRIGLRYVTEERSLFRSLTVHENLRLGRGSIGRALDMFPELAGMLKRRAGLLSGGEQQMLILGRALSADPAALLVDELSLGLAPVVVDRLLVGVRAAAEQGTGVLLVEQQIRAALEVADFAYVMRRGRILLQGAAADLRGRIPEIEALYLAGAPDPGDAISDERAMGEGRVDG
jgi:branched-chain amino acid transport system ATP-binding protein